MKAATRDQPLVAGAAAPLGPLGMVDTGYVLRRDQVPRLAAVYVGKPANPNEPGLRRLDEQPGPFLTPERRQPPQAAARERQPWSYTSIGGATGKRSPVAAGAAGELAVAARQSFCKAGFRARSGKWHDAETR